MELLKKEVYFGRYCSTCKHRNLHEAEDPCDACLEQPCNDYSHKPTKYEEDVNQNGNDRMGRAGNCCHQERKR